MQREEQVRQIAYKIWEDEGYPQGKDQEHWFKAEAEWREKMEHMADDLVGRTDIVTPGAHPEPQPERQPIQRQAAKRTVKSPPRRSRSIRSEGRGARQS